MKIFSTILLALLALARSAVAEAGADFDAANKLYNQGNYPAAVAAYDQLIQSGAAGATVQFNLGNACFKAGQFGRAIAAFRRAEQISPRDPDVRANLQFARNQVAGNDSVRPNILQRALDKLTLNEWTWLAVVAFWTWFSLLAMREWKPELRRGLGRFTLLAGLLTLLLGGCAGGDWAANHSVKTAVVIGNNSVARTGPLDDAQNAFTLKDGTELTVRDQREDWLQVTDSHNRIGWVKRDVVQVL